MKSILISLLLSFVGMPTLVLAQEKKEPAPKMVEFHMALLKRGPKWSEKGMSPEVEKGHLAHVLSLLDTGKAVIAGPLADDGDLVGIYIRAPSPRKRRSRGPIATRLCWPAI